MRNIFLLAVFATGLGISVAKAENLLPQLSLSPKDPKYNSHACRSMREKARHYNGFTLRQSPQVYIFAAVMPGGTLGFLALQNQKREFFKAKVEQACMTHPPDRSYLDPAGSGKE
jgi:hypothetical protein